MSRPAMFGWGFTLGFLLGWAFLEIIIKLGS